MTRADWAWLAIGLALGGYAMNIYDMLSRDDLVFDVGAHQGNKAVQYVERGCRVICFEPQPSSAAYLRERFAGTGVQVVESAVGADATVGTLYECDQTGTISSMSREWVEAGLFSKDHTWSKQTKVTVTTLDAARLVYGQPTFVKIDVEGYEAEVLRGLSAPVPLLSFEFHSVDMGKVRDCIARLTELGMYHYNVALDEHPEMLFSDWVTALDVQERIKMHVSEHGPWWGDIYVALDPNVAEAF